jgi:hypothetical protein
MKAHWATRFACRATRASDSIRPASAEGVDHAGAAQSGASSQTFRAGSTSSSTASASRAVAARSLRFSLAGCSAFTGTPPVFRRSCARCPSAASTHSAGCRAAGARAPTRSTPCARDTRPGSARTWSGSSACWSPARFVRACPRAALSKRWLRHTGSSRRGPRRQARPLPRASAAGRAPAQRPPSRPAVSALNLRSYPTRSAALRAHAAAR